MYDDDYEIYHDDDYDFAYESYREETGHITNFDKWQEPAYAAAIEEYKMLKNSTDLYINTGYRWPGTMGLYGSISGDLGNFWRIFDKHDEVLRKQLGRS